MLAGGIVFRERVQTDKRPVLHDQKVLAQAVVQFSGDALALVLLRFDEASRECFTLSMPPLQTMHATPDSQSSEAEEYKHAQQPEPQLLPEWSAHDHDE